MRVAINRRDRRSYRTDFEVPRYQVGPGAGAAISTLGHVLCLLNSPEELEAVDVTLIEGSLHCVHIAYFIPLKYR